MEQQDYGGYLGSVVTKWALSRDKLWLRMIRATLDHPRGCGRIVSRPATLEIEH